MKFDGFQIADEHWSFCGMREFRPRATHYEFPFEAATDRIDFEIVPLASVRSPPARMVGARELPKERIVPILLAISSGRPLPPVHVEREDDGGYRLVHGFHRYCASVAAGFTQIPVVFHEIAWCRPGR